MDEGFLCHTDLVLEQQYLPPAVADFFLVALTWCMVGWALRLAYIAMSLIELRHAIDQNRVSVHGDVPLHALVPGLDPLSRSRFLSFLRARSPATPAAAVGELRQPVALRRAALCVAPGGAGVVELELELDCAEPVALQLAWGLSHQAVAALSLIHI